MEEVLLWGVRCIECKTDIEDSDIQVTCPECGGEEFEQYDLIEAMVEQAGLLGDAATLIVERKPELRERVEAMLADARLTVEKILPMEKGEGVET